MMKKLPLLIALFLLMTGCQQKGHEVVHFENTEVQVLGNWQVDVSGVVGSVKGTIYNGDIWTYEDIKITATVYDLQGNPVMSESTHIPRLAPNISHNFTIAKALGKDPSRKWERVVWDLNFRNKKIGFVEEVLLEMPSQQQEIWANIIYSHNTFTVNLWPTIFDMDRQLAELAIQR